MSQLTTRVQIDGGRPRLFRRRFEVSVIAGPDRGRAMCSSDAEVTVGTAPSNTLVLTDPAVSRFHLRIERDPRGFSISDLDTTNGTTLPDGLALGRVTTVRPLELQLGKSRLRFSPLDEEEEIPLDARDRMGAALGRSAAMREVFGLLERLAKAGTSVLLWGETGTGKEVLASELHRHSTRRDAPFVVLDCGAIPPSLVESELFGHVRGAFTGATADRPGVFEQAHRGTVLLDEIGELELAVQPRLLRVLESGEVKRVGEAQHRKVDVRVIAATHRDLQRAVNQGTFRADLYYRLAVATVRIPPLRERTEDIPLIAEALLRELARRTGNASVPVLGPDELARLQAHPWPGNVRELRNFLERLAALHGDATLDPFAGLEARGPARAVGLDDLLELPFREAKAAWIAQFDVEYVRRLLEACEHNVAEAARRSGIDRVHLFRMIKKYGLSR